ncbi:N-6 DNA methylase, partial [bacterium]|nr:N-6 DNA methylase [bacterium]
MPVEPKPLFRPDLIRQHLKQFHLPQRVGSLREKLGWWTDLITSGRINEYKESQLLPDFLTDFFYGLLGFAGPVNASDGYTISREELVKVDGKFADAVLGRFGTGTTQYVAALEGKGPKDPLDRPFAGRKMSAVDQCYRYAINLPCDWLIVTSIRQTRLYFKGTDQHTYERFDTETLAQDERLLKRFVFLLGAERVTPETGNCHLFALREASEKIGKQLTKDFYVRYADIRQDVFEQLAVENSSYDRHDILSSAQKLLDRVLFIAFCEDRGLLPEDSLKNAYEHRDPYNPRPIWENFKGLFRAVDEGNDQLNIPHYNGGLFANDLILDSLTIPDQICLHFRDLGDYDYRPANDALVEGDFKQGCELIDVEILGHIFEQSITDLEKLRNELDGLTPPVGSQKHKTRRKKEGAFYTPAFITRYIVEQTLGEVLADLFEQLRSEHAEKTTHTARRVLQDPSVYDSAKLNNPQRAALVDFWEEWQERLKELRVLDPSCGSGAFLIEAFDHLHAAYERSNDRLEELRGYRSLFELDRRILQHNLYGVDINEEAIEICKLSLWIKTAARNRVLTSLDHTLRVGNSVVSDTTLDPRAFNWQTAFPEVFANGGFDAVIGNPPYVRQELLTEFKSYLEQNYAAYDGVADLYTYFYELGIRLLRPGGRLSFIVTNKWMRAGYGKPLRKFFNEQAWIESVVDFGHAKQIFEQADVFPSIIVARRPNEAPAPQNVRVCAIPREQLRINDLSEQIQTEGVEVPRQRLQADAWSLEPPAVNDLMQKIVSTGHPMKEFIGSSPLYGIKTGCNDAFLIDTPTRNRLVREDPSSADIIKKYLRGQDIKRWVPGWDEQWMIFARKGVDIDAYPAVKSHLETFRERLEPKPRDWKPTAEQRTWPGRASGSYAWYELQTPVEFWEEFEKPKIVYQEIQFHPWFCFDTDQYYANNKAFILPTNDLYLLAVLNSPLMWWHNFRYLPHMKDEALTPAGFRMENLPIAQPTGEIRAEVHSSVERLLQISRERRGSTSVLLDWLKIEFELPRFTRKLQNPLDLELDDFLSEVRKIRGRRNSLSAVGLRSLKDEYQRTVAPVKAGLSHETGTGNARYGPRYL